jgi:transcriptional regulator with XRE-family HTH domain
MSHGLHARSALFRARDERITIRIGYQFVTAPARRSLEHMPSDTEIALAPTAVTVGRALKEARLRRGLTTRQVAALAGVSQSFLSNVENGRALPSIPSLYALAGSLGIAPAEVLPESFAPLEVTRAGAGARVPLGDEAASSRGSMARISGSSNHRLDVYELELEPGYRQGPVLRHPGEDLVYIVEGALEVQLDDESRVLEAGDSLWWDGERAHAFRIPEPERRAVRAVMVSRSLPSAGGAGGGAPATDASATSTTGVAPEPPPAPEPPHAPDELALAHDVGRAVRAERRSRGLTLRGLAREVGVSQPFLSNVENGRSLPSVPLLYSIATALDIPPSRIMPRQARDSLVTHSGDAAVALDGGPAAPATGSVTSPLSFARDRLLEAHHLVLQPGYRQPEELAHRGEDFVYVLSGELLLHVGDESARLRAGDAARFDAQLPHRLSVAASAPAPATALLVTAND